MERERQTPPSAHRYRGARREFEAELDLLENPDAPAVSQWPPRGDSTNATQQVLSPQTIGTNFQTVSLAPPGFAESGNIPPDPMGDVGPTQILAATNGRIKVFDKAGNVGALNADLDTFFSSVANGQGTTDPEVRYDRLSGRWFVLVANLSATNNRILIAVSSG